MLRRGRYGGREQGEDHPNGECHRRRETSAHGPQLL
jgi:hypothetical protein